MKSVSSFSIIETFLQDIVNVVNGGFAVSAIKVHNYFFEKQYWLIFFPPLRVKMRTWYFDRLRVYIQNILANWLQMHVKYPFCRSIISLNATTYQHNMHMIYKRDFGIESCLSFSLVKYMLKAIFKISRAIKRIPNHYIKLGVGFDKTKTRDYVILKK